MMGTIVHHAIVITSWKNEALDDLVQFASDAGAVVIGPSSESVNGYRTVTVCPDGSKEGWADSNLGDATRAKIKEWLRAKRYDDDESSALEWVEVAYGNDMHAEGEAAQIEDSEWSDR